MKPNSNKKKSTRGQQVGRPKDTKGNWEASLCQRGKNQLNEATIKAKCATGNFDHSKLNSMRFKTKTVIETLIEKQASGKKLTKPEKMILSIQEDRDKKERDVDMEKLEKHGIKAEVSTEYGRIHRILMTASYILSLDKPNKYEDIYYIYRKLLKFNKVAQNLEHIPMDIRTNPDYLEVFESFNLINSMPSIVDTIELQFNKYHGSMPPLDNMEFTALDEWQKEYLDLIDANKSIVVEASTSAGKTILTGYIFLKKKRTIFIVPTDPLALSTAAMIGKITGDDVPIITETFKSCTSTDELIKKIERCQIVVGTAQHVLNFLPRIKVEWECLVIDEIHMIGAEKSGEIEDNNREMELFCKTYNNIQTILLSATIGNVDSLKEWLERCGHVDINIIKCTKRFFDLQRFYYKDNQLVRIHPLSNITIEDIKSGEVLKKTINTTPPDTWVLAMSLKKLCDIDPYVYFKKTQVITLDEANDYFKLLLKWMVDNYTTNKKAITSIIESYNHDALNAEHPSLYDLAMLLKEQEKTPALIFQTDSHICLEYVREFSRTIREKEGEDYPDLLKKRLKEQSRAKSNDKKMEQLGVDKMKPKQLQKLMMSGQLDEPSSESVIIYEPTSRYNLNKHQYFSQHAIDEWNKELKMYFPSNGSEYHWIIDLLWRGVGVYVKGLPDAYLHIIQNLACNGKLAIVFSDKSLVFGISMPFRTSVITPDDNINPMMYHQMAGRAGRRGLDKEGNVVFAGFSGKQIQELSTSSIPNIVGRNTMFYGSVYASRLSMQSPLVIDLSTESRWNNIKSNFLLDKITNEDAKEFYDSIEENLLNGWNFADSKNKHFIHMCWSLRHSEDCIRVPFLLGFIRKIFCNSNPSNEKTQVEFSKFLLQFIDCHQATDDIHVLSPVECSKQYNIHEHFDKLDLSVPSRVDSRVFESIQQNSMSSSYSTKEKSVIRYRLFKFGMKIETIQHYFFFSEEVVLARLLSKMLTRIWWIYHMSSPVMESIVKFIPMTNSTEEEEEEEEDEDEYEEEDDDDE